MDWKRLSFTIAWPGIALVLVTSCTMTDPKPRDPAKVAPLPEAYSRFGHVELPPNRWWRAFDDPDLDLLIEYALTNNTSLAQAESRLRQARAAAVIQGAERSPTLNLRGGAESRETESTNPDGTTTSDAREGFSLGLAAAYELDLWGRIRANTRSAKLTAEAVRADWETAAVTLSSEIALRYYELIATRQGIDLIEKQLVANKKILDLTDLRFRRTQASSLDVLQQKELVSQTEGLLPNLRAREEVLHYELAVLLGKVPSGPLPLSSRTLPNLSPLPNLGLPADLLERRPDLRAAWLRLLSAEWAELSAEADRLPAVRFTASGDFDSDNASALFDNWMLNLAGNLTAPLLDGGRRRAEVERRKAEVGEQLEKYWGTALGAMLEVQNALATEDGGNQTLQAQEERLSLSSQSRELAMNRFGKGQENYLRVLSAITAEENLRRSIVQTRFDNLRARVQLYRALGGDWARPLAEALSEKDAQ